MSRSTPVKWWTQLVYTRTAGGLLGSLLMISVTPSMTSSSMSPSRRLFSLTATVENLSWVPISAAVRTTPRRQPAAHTKISCASGMSIPVWTMFHVPRAGDEYSSPDRNGAGKLASAILTCGISEASSFIFCFSFTFFSILSFPNCRSL